MDNDELEIFRKFYIDIQRIIEEYIQNEEPAKIIALMIAKRGKDAILKAVENA